MAEQFINLADRGVTLCIDRAGEGPPLLVMTGTGSDLRNQPNPLRWPMAPHFDTLIYDHRGLGQSEQHDPDYQPTMADFAADALALCDEQGFDEFSVLAISFGAMVAQELATISGTRLKRLVLCCTSSGGQSLHRLLVAICSLPKIPKHGLAFCGFCKHDVPQKRRGMNLGVGGFLLHG